MDRGKKHNLGTMSQDEGFVVELIEGHALIESLQESEYQLRQMVDELPAAIYKTDAEGRITFYNKAAVELWGREPEIGKDLWCGSWKIFTPDGNPVSLDECPMAVGLKEQRPVRGVEIVVERPDGTRRNILPHPQPLFNTKGELVEMVNTLADITDLKKARFAIQESEERFRQMANVVPQIVWTARPDGVFDFLNSYFWQFAQMEEGYDGRALSLVHPDDVEASQRKWLACVEAREPFENEYRLLDNSTGTYRWLLSRAWPIPGSSNEIARWLGICTDIHERKTIAEELEKKVEERTRSLMEANQELERSNRELEQFAYVASHDLKEPIRMVSTFASLLAERYPETVDENIRDYVSYIKDGALRMQELVNDLLAYSRIGKGNIATTQVDCNQVLSIVQSNLDRKIEETGATVKVGSLPTIKAVKTQMVQLFQNLVDNAIKFRRSVPPLIEVSCTDTGNHWQFQVSDNGVGIDPKYASRVFAIFQRLHHRQQYPGTGIGLSNVKKIVELHNGRIWLESVPGTGTTFFFTLPK